MAHQYETEPLTEDLFTEIMQPEDAMLENVYASSLGMMPGGYADLVAAGQRYEQKAQTTRQMLGEFSAQQHDAELFDRHEVASLRAFIKAQHAARKDPEFMIQLES